MPRTPPVIARALRALREKLLSAASRERISLMDDADFEATLVRLGLWEALSAGKLHCAHCSDVLTKETVQGLQARDGRFVLLCHKTTCTGGELKA